MATTTHRETLPATVADVEPHPYEDGQTFVKVDIHHDEDTTERATIKTPTPTIVAILRAAGEAVATCNVERRHVAAEVHVDEQTGSTTHRPARHFDEIQKPAGTDAATILAQLDA